MKKLFSRGRIGKLGDQLSKIPKKYRTHTQEYIIKQSKRRLIDKISDPTYDSRYWTARLLDILEINPHSQ